MSLYERCAIEGFDRAAHFLFQHRGKPVLGLSPTIETKQALHQTGIGRETV